MKKFNITEGILIERKNRYLGKVKVSNEVVDAYIPNPGRMLEIMYPGIKLYLHYSNFDSNTNRKTKWTVIGTDNNNIPVMIYSTYMNFIAEKLINENLIEELIDYKIIKKEIKHGNSRFDFLLENKFNSKQKMYLEVKCCTLVYNKIASFPDAPTVRGTKHLLELTELTNNNIKSCVLILITGGKPKFFYPNVHTDNEFAMTFFKCSNKIMQIAYHINFDKYFSENIKSEKVFINYNITETLLKNSGNYLLLIEVKKSFEITVGKLGKIHFLPGYYIYIGSGKRNLVQRVQRHLRKRKKIKWHIDYLLSETKVKIIKSFLIKTTENYECNISYKIKNISDNSINNFGSSDCKCKSHLFYFKNNPYNKKDFIDIVFDFMFNQ